MRADIHPPTRQGRSSSRREDRTALRDFPRSAIAPLVPFRAPPWSSAAQLQAYGLELQALVAHIVSQRADRGGFRLSTASSWSTRCTNNFDRLLPRGSSRRVLSPCLYHRVSTAHRTHSMIIITTSRWNPPSPIRTPSHLSESLNARLISARARSYLQALAFSRPEKIFRSSSTRLAPACYART